jgi:hypothetical protein
MRYAQHIIDCTACQLIEKAQTKIRKSAYQSAKGEEYIFFFPLGELQIISSILQLYNL